MAIISKGELRGDSGQVRALFVAGLENYQHNNSKADYPYKN
jgi:hypothetical protein